MRALLLAIILSLAVLSPAHAMLPDEVLPNPALEARARAISAELRCLVCQNQSIDDSDAPLARDLRIIVRERLLAGDTDTQVRDFVVARYGEFVLLRPVLAAHTIVLWIAAPLVLILGMAGVVLAARRRSAVLATTTIPSALTPEEEAALARLQERDR
ncbi:cytochrome c-type biogenesis protein CcmH [Devosia enhydra]|uniref:Cytochrome c-type biogenesis protein n=1 Tax=Devosia enhydra TaxID=665118 RepID=A0A1K2I0L8_9HYPH|nr:cytochrome c-type biogenesis protein [Devosia enhydra]SFZ85857.1 cytochrome c-type biogenesis protein CcmH [Devosia enhydra]